MNEEKRALKRQYIPLFVAGKITNKECARLCGLSVVSVSRIKKRYLQKGDNAFIHGHTGKPSHNLKFTDTLKKQIIDNYSRYWKNAPFQVAYEYTSKELQIKISRPTFSKILNDVNIHSPLERMPKKYKKLHKPRKEREQEGELCQLDGCKHEWFIGNEKTCIHGGIDDATHKITALYMCENECLLGYYEIMRQSAERNDGHPKAVYTDRSAIFVTTKNNLEYSTIQEQLEGYKKKPTQWQKMCKELSIDTILALSPEAKGRIERLWQTLQNRLPFIFLRFGIDTIKQANIFLKSFVDDFNKRFAIAPQKDGKLYHKNKTQDLDFVFSVKEKLKSKRDGTFNYHGEKFKIPYRNQEFTLCLSERFGIKAYFNNQYFDVELVYPIMDTVSDIMPIVEKSLIRKYLMNDTHSNNHKLSANF